MFNNQITKTSKTLHIARAVLLLSAFVIGPLTLAGCSNETQKSQDNAREAPLPGLGPIESLDPPKRNRGGSSRR